MLFIITSCKKNANPPLTNNTTNTTQQNSHIVSGGFTINKRININAQTQLGDTIIESSYLFYSPAYDLDSWTGALSCNVGNVFINNIQLQKSIPIPGCMTYQDSTTNLKTFPLNFSVLGSTNFSSSTFTITDNWEPVFSNFNQVPTTISKSAGCTFTLSNLSNNSLGTEVYLGNLLCSTTGNVISYTPAQLSGVPVSSTVLMRITLKGGDTYILLDGKNYLIQGELRYYYSNINVIP